MKATLVIEYDKINTLLRWALDAPEGVKLLDAREGDKIPRLVAEEVTETHENSPSAAQDRVCLTDEADICDYLNRAVRSQPTLDVCYKSVLTGAVKEYIVRVLSVDAITVTIRDLNTDGLKTFYISGIRRLEGPAL